MDTKNSRTSDPQILLQNLSNSVNLRKGIAMLLYQTLAPTTHE